MGVSVGSVEEIATIMYRSRLLSSNPPSYNYQHFKQPFQLGLFRYKITEIWFYELQRNSLMII